MEKSEVFGASAPFEERIIPKVPPDELQLDFAIKGNKKPV